MRQVQLSDQLYEAASRFAHQGGFASVDDFVADMLAQGFDPAENHDHLFTPEIIAQLDDAVAEARATKSYTIAEVDSRLAANRESWLSSRGNLK